MKTKKANIQFFMELGRGASVGLFSASKEYPELEWVHDHVDRDLVCGKFSLLDGRTVPLDAYLYDDGEGTVSFGLGSHLDVEYGISLNGGIVFLEPPLPSEFPQRSTFTGYVPNPKFSYAERVAITTFRRRYADIGFNVDDWGNHAQSLFLERVAGCCDLMLERGQTL
ncbi:hypothetical protein EN766_39845, partial [Mesorhizobium sp. M2A.F.Ca.ET.046.02.1.1]